MLNRRGGSVQAHRNVTFGKRLDLNPGSSSSNSPTSTSVSAQADPSQASTASSATPTLPVSSHSAFTFLTNSLPLSVSNHGSSVTVVVDFPSATPIASSLPLRNSSFPSITLVTPPTSSVASSTTVSSSLASSSATDVTLTSMSDAVPVAVTTVFSSAAVSQAPAPRPTSSSFLQNKAESGAVLGVVSLVVLVCLGYISRRLYRSVKERQADRETEYAARDAANVKVRLDDDDDVYGMSSKGRGNMLPIFNRPSGVPLDFGTNGSLGAGTLDGNRPPARGISPYLDDGAVAYNVSLPLHHQPRAPSPYLPPPFDPVVHSTQTLDSRRPSSESTDNLIPTRSEWNMPPGIVSQTVPSQVAASSRSPLPLPETFGEGEPGHHRDPALTKSLGDNEDYSGAIRRVLKIANE